MESPLQCNKYFPILWRTSCPRRLLGCTLHFTQISELYFFILLQKLALEKVKMIHKNAVAYSATTLAATMMNSIFQFYYVKIFLSVYK